MSTSPLDRARALLAAGYAVGPVPYREKGSVLTGWPDLRLAEAELPHYFNCTPMNIAVLTGAASGGRVDVDVDHESAVALGDDHLPTTGAVWGRASKPKSHRIYTCSIASQQFQVVRMVTGPDGKPSRQTCMIIEIRSDRLQSLAPGSVHPSGEPVRWDAEGEPAAIEPVALRASVVALADAAFEKANLAAEGWTKSWASTSGTSHTHPCAAGSSVPIENFLSALGSRGYSPKKTTNGWICRCPAHEDSNPSLSISQGTDGRVLLKCFAGCQAQSIAAALGLGLVALFTGTSSRMRNRHTGAPVCPGSPDCPATYEDTSQGIVWNKASRDGPVRVLLTNFTAKVVARIVRDDGAERRQVFSIDARIGTGPVINIDVPAERFASMNWPVEHLGINAVVSAGMGAKDHARAAIQSLSQNVPDRVVYLHLGWTSIGNKSVFLHAGGAIGRDGEVDGVDVHPPSDLSKYVLPPPPMEEELRDCVRESLRLLYVKPYRVTVPLLTGMYRCVLGSCTHSLHVAGSTGALKSSTVAAYLCHFGRFDDHTLPGSWMSTDNALEAISFAAKDVPFVVDDFAPTGTSHDQQRLHARAERLLRGAGNQQGRGRLKSDTSFRATKFPRGLIISTGEDTPNGQSLRARVLVSEIVPGEVDRRLLSEIQRKAGAEVFSKAMSGYLAWLAGRLEHQQQTLSSRVRELRDGAAGARSHLRTPVILAEQLAGLETFLRFAVDCGAIGKDEAGAHVEHAHGELTRIAEAQSAHQRESDPVLRFLSLAASALTSGLAHLANAISSVESPDDAIPSDPAAWGWRPYSVGGRTEWRAQGERVGWIEGENVYLEADAAHRAANRAAGDFPLGMPAKTLAKRLYERGFLVRRESEDHIGVKIVLHGTRHRVLHLSARSLGGPGQSGQSVSDRPQDNPSGGSVPNLCPDSESDATTTGTEKRDALTSCSPEPGDERSEVPDAPIVPDAGVSPHHDDLKFAPGPPSACRACGRRHWWSTSGLIHWTCGGCRGTPPRDHPVIYWIGNEVAA